MKESPKYFCKIIPNRFGIVDSFFYNIPSNDTSRKRTFGPAYEALPVEFLLITPPRYVITRRAIPCIFRCAALQTIVINIYISRLPVRSVGAFVCNSICGRAGIMYIRFFCNFVVVTAIMLNSNFTVRAGRKGLHRYIPWKFCR